MKTQLNSQKSPSLCFEKYFPCSTFPLTTCLKYQQNHIFSVSFPVFIWWLDAEMLKDLRTKLIKHKERKLAYTATLRFNSIN